MVREVSWASPQKTADGTSELCGMTGAEDVRSMLVRSPIR